MVAFTTAKQLILAANSSYVGIWDQPTNSNWSVVDAALGGFTTISLNNSPVTLSAPQFQSAMITFNSTLTGDVAITFPTSFVGFYTIQNICSGSTAFSVTLKTTAAGGQIIGCMPYEPFGIINDGTNIKFRGLGKIGSYWDYGGSSVPAWVTACTVPPYLNCDGTTFSSAVYPALAVILGGTTLPDSMGRARIALNQGTSRVTSSVSGIDGATRGAAGGNEAQQQHNHVINITDPGHAHIYIRAQSGQSGLASGGATVGDFGNATSTQVTNITATSNNTGAGTSQNMPPSYVGGLTLIRAA